MTSKKGTSSGLSRSWKTFSPTSISKQRSNSVRLRTRGCYQLKSILILRLTMGVPEPPPVGKVEGEGDAEGEIHGDPMGAAWPSHHPWQGQQTPYLPPPPPGYSPYVCPPADAKLGHLHPKIKPLMAEYNKAPGLLSFWSLTVALQNSSQVIPPSSSSIASLLVMSLAASGYLGLRVLYTLLRCLPNTSRFCLSVLSNC